MDAIFLISKLYKVCRHRSQLMGGLLCVDEVVSSCMLLRKTWRSMRLFFSKDSPATPPKESATEKTLIMTDAANESSLVVDFATLNQIDPADFSIPRLLISLQTIHGLKNRQKSRYIAIKTVFPAIRYDI
ncbi:hypothetical protein ACHQM5_013502 [Ranunculus cassubicifolius]